MSKGADPDVTVKVDAEKMRKTLKDCVNELCLLCGDYKTEHIGSCNGCRWKDVKAEVSRRDNG